MFLLLFYNSRGDCLITVSTGNLSKEDEERFGLVATHAYAVLDLREVYYKYIYIYIL